MILVTGGTGFLGRHLIPALVQAGYRVRVLTRRPDPWLERCASVTSVIGNILDRASVQRAAAGCRMVVHAAGYFRFWGSERDFDATNVAGTQHLLDALANTVERVVHISTLAVIGQPSPDKPIDETHPAQPVDAYQRSKLRAETLALTHHRQHGTPIVVLRPGAFYGPLGRYGFNRLFFRDPMRGIIMQVDGGRHIIFPVYIGDVAASIVQALACGRAGEIYNICGESLSHREAYDIICAEAGLRFPRLPVPGWLGISMSRAMTALASITHREPFYPLNLRSYVYNDWRVSTEKARRELGFQPTSFRDGARTTIAWYRAGQPDTLPELTC